jgi:DNA-binding winged helix-turn-helix (wHTH) protein
MQITGAILGNDMNINLKVVGESMYRSLSKDVKALNNAFFKLSRQSETVEVTISLLADRPQADDLLHSPESPSILVVDAQDLTLIDKIQSMEKRELLFMKDPMCVPLVMSPLITIFPSHEPLADVREFPDLVSDWMFQPINLSELARRILSSLRRKNILKTKLRFGSLTLVPESRLIAYFGRTIHLTRSEFALAEMFLGQMGSVIPLSDLVLLFKSTGKSTEGSNIRVTIFQLRLKLEMLTKGLFTVASVYKRGYCLKQKAKSFSRFDSAPGGMERLKEGTLLEELD